MKTTTSTTRTVHVLNFYFYKSNHGFIVQNNRSVLGIKANHSVGMDGIGRSIQYRDTAGKGNGAWNDRPVVSWFLVQQDFEKGPAVHRTNVQALVLVKDEIVNCLERSLKDKLAVRLRVATVHVVVTLDPSKLGFGAKQCTLGIELDRIGNTKASRHIGRSVTSIGQTNLDDPTLK